MSPLVRCTAFLRKLGFPKSFVSRVSIRFNRVNFFSAEASVSGAKYLQIELDEALALYSVWEYIDGDWELLAIARIGIAISLARTGWRLVFPNKLDPNKIPLQDEDFHPRVSPQKNVLAFVRVFPGQTPAFIAQKLNLSVPNARKHLYILEKRGFLYSHYASGQKYIKLYYPANPSSLKKSKVTC